MSSFLEATSLTGSNGSYTARLDLDWFIWGPFGGYIAAIALRAIGERSAQPRPATFTCQYLNVGNAGSVQIEVDSLRSGRVAECLNARIRQSGTLLLEARSWFIADEVEGFCHEAVEMPDVHPPHALAPFEAPPDSREEQQAIWTHIERRPNEQISDAPADPRWSCWLRLTQSVPSEDPILQAARAVLWMDMAPWNAVLRAHSLPTRYIAPTLELTVHFLPSLYSLHNDESTWLLARVESPVAAGGLVSSRGELWTQSRKLVAVGTAQCLCRPNP